MWLTRQPPSPEVEAGPFPRPFVLKTRSLASAGAPRRDRPRRWAFMQADRYGQSKDGRTSFDVALLVIGNQRVRREAHLVLGPFREHDVLRRSVRVE